MLYSIGICTYRIYKTRSNHQVASPGHITRSNHQVASPCQFNHQAISKLSPCPLIFTQIMLSLNPVYAGGQADKWDSQELLFPPGLPTRINLPAFPGILSSTDGQIRSRTSSSWRIWGDDLGLTLRDPLYRIVHSRIILVSINQVRYLWPSVIILDNIFIQDSTKTP